MNKINKVLGAMIILVISAANLFALEPWKLLKRVQDTSRQIIQVTGQDVTVPENYSCSGEIKGELGDKLKAITEGRQDIVVKKFFRQRGNICDITLFADSKEGARVPAAELKMALTPMNIMLKKITHAERLNAIAGITFISYFDITDLKDVYNIAANTGKLNDENVNIITLTYKKPSETIRTYVSKWMLWTDRKKDIVKKIRIEKVVKSKTDTQTKEETVITEAEYKYDKFGKIYLPVEVIEPNENQTTLIKYIAQNGRFLVTSMEFRENGETKSSMVFKYKQYENSFLPVEVNISGKEKIKMTGDYVKVGDYYVPGLEKYEVDNLAPVEVRYFEFEIDRPVREEPFGDIEREREDREINVEDFLEQTSVIEEQER